MAQRPFPLPTGVDLPSSAAAQDIRDSACREVFGDAYDALSATFKADANDEFLNAFFDVTNLAKWWLLTDPSYVNPDPPELDELPPEFNEVFKLVIVSKLLRRFRGGPEGHIYWTQNVVPAIQRVGENIAPQFNISTTLDDSISINSLRRSIISILVRQRTPVIPPFDASDRTIREEFVKLWEARKWSFRVRPMKLNLAISGDLTPASGPTYKFRGIASKYFMLRTSNNVRHKIQWSDSTRFAEQKAAYDGTTGTPRFFFDWAEGDTERIEWAPMPDQAYVLFANIFIGPPNFTNANDSTIDNGLSSLPVPFRANLRDMVIGKLMSLWGREDTDAARVLATAEKERISLAPMWADRGASRHTARGHHHLLFPRQLLSNQSSIHRDDPTIIGPSQ